MKITQLRISSIDVFRALTMLLMIFVNDFWTLKGIPQWLEHSAADVDFLGFSDVIFPCFLFILGQSIPFAIQNRLAKGDSTFQLIKHIALRSVALLVMGLFTVNTPDLNAEATGMAANYYILLMVIGFFLVWNVYPKATDWKQYVFIGLQVAGIALLVWLAIIFKGNAGDQILGMRPQWWGILGLIGWTYLGCAVVYVLVWRKSVAIPVFWALSALFTIIHHAHWPAIGALQTAINWIPGAGAFHCFAFAGMTATLLLEKHYAHKPRLMGIYILLGIGLLISGLVARNFFIISKIYATPTWVFLCSGIAFLAYAFLFWLVEQQKKAHWFDIIKVAGTQTLTCYLIPYAYYSIADLSGLVLLEALKTGIVGLIKSMVYAFIVIGIAALLGRARIKLKI